MGLMDFIKSQLHRDHRVDRRLARHAVVPVSRRGQGNQARRAAHRARVADSSSSSISGQFGDQFGPGKHTLTTDNIPDPVAAQGLEVRLRVAVQGRRLLRHHPPVHRQQVGHVEPGDDAGPGLRDRARAGLRHLRFPCRRTPKLFLKEVAGTDDHFRLDEFADAMRSRIVSVFSEALATSKVPVLDVATRYSELGEALLPADQSVLRRQVRPRDAELHPRERLGAGGGRAGDRQALQHGRGRQPQRLREVPDGPRHGEGGAGTGGRGRRDGGRVRDCPADDQPDGRPRRRRRRRGVASAPRAGGHSRDDESGRRRQGARRDRDRRRRQPRVRRPQGQADRYASGASPGAPLGVPQQ